MQNNASQNIEQELIEATKSHELTKEYLIKAEIIGFKNVPDKVYKTDKFGFIIEKYIVINLEKIIRK